MILGIDEVGRGPWAGPLVVGAVVLGGTTIEGLTDSKKLSKKQRERLAPIIKSTATAWALGWVTANELDTIGMSEALKLATRRAVEQIKAPYSEIVIDGTVNFLADTGKGKYVTCLPKADLLVPSVSAASVLAKVARDDYMAEQDTTYPGYDFKKHAGYGVAAHRAAIDKLGVTPLHRLSFAPLQKYQEGAGVPQASASVASTSRRPKPSFVSRFAAGLATHSSQAVTKADFGGLDGAALGNNAKTDYSICGVRGGAPAEKEAPPCPIQPSRFSVHEERVASTAIKRVNRDGLSRREVAHSFSAGAPTTKQIGDNSETEVANYLTRHGHTIRERNWRTKWCEIDIVSEKGGVLYFTEVKHRKNDKAGDGFDAITPKKLNQMKFAAELYATKNPGYDLQLAVAKTTGEPPVLGEYLKLD